MTTRGRSWVSDSKGVLLLYHYYHYLVIILYLQHLISWLIKHYLESNSKQLNNYTVTYITVSWKISYDVPAGGQVGYSMKEYRN